MIHVSATLGLQQSITSPVLSPAIANNKVCGDSQNGPAKKNTNNATNNMNDRNAIEKSPSSNETSSNHQPFRGNEGGNYSPSASINPIPQGGGGSGSRRAPTQLYVAPHIRNRTGDRCNDRDQDSSPRSNDGHTARERVVRIHNSASKNDYGHHHHH